MTLININNALAGLGLLSGQRLALPAPGAIESRPVREAKAQYTLAPVTPPWKEKTSTASLATQVSLIRRMGSIVESVRLSGPSLPADVRTAFITYRALDRLRMLTEYALSTSRTTAERQALNFDFMKGVNDLQRFLSGAPADLLTLSFAQPQRRAESRAIPALPDDDRLGRPVAAQRADPVAGLSGTERFTLRLASAHGSDSIAVDLGAGPQPPTLDSVAAALNAAIASVPMRNQDGSIALDPDGNPRPRWATRFDVVKGDEGWGLSLRTMGYESVSLTGQSAGDTLMVAANELSGGAAASAGLFRFAIDGAALDRQTLGTLAATDPLATERRDLAAAPIDLGAAPAAPIPADLSVAAMASDGAGFTYVVGTARGDSGALRGDGQDDLLVTKLDGQGAIVWQRSLGTAGSAEGNAISIGDDGSIAVAATVQGDTDGATSDGDLMILHLGADGDTLRETLVRSVGLDRAAAVALADDGSILVGGSSGSDALLARIGPDGRLAERQRLDSGGSEKISSLALAPDGSLVVLAGHDGQARVSRYDPANLSAALATADLGSFDASALAIADDGTIAIGGAVVGAGGRDRRLVLLEADLSVRTDQLGSDAANDRIDSLAFTATGLFAGGRSGSDGFVARLDTATGSTLGLSQWRRADRALGPVLLSADRGGGDEAVEALGFARGLLNPARSERLTAVTSLRPGDQFSLSIDGKEPIRVDIAASDTAESLADRLSALAGRTVKVTTSRDEDGVRLRLEPATGHRLDLAPGAPGHDALDKLGLEPGRLVANAPISPKAPRVRPGGNYGLELSRALSIDTLASARLTLDKLSDAITTTQSAFRSLFWDDNKRAIVEGAAGGTGRVTPYLSRQLGRYQDALNRLGGFRSL